MASIDIERTMKEYCEISAHKFDNFYKKNFFGKFSDVCHLREPPSMGTALHTSVDASLHRGCIYQRKLVSTGLSVHLRGSLLPWGLHHTPQRKAFHLRGRAAKQQ